MPVDPTRASTSSRRSQKKVTEEELKEIELKRIRGELSCAECRRLKLRCDKKVPCSSCSRRGCESICPCGILSAGQGTRFILADTEQLHRKIAEMSNRIRRLEDALAILQSTVSDERHPLLEDDLLKIKFGSEALDGRQADQGSKEHTAKQSQSIDALGTLSLGDSGEVKYFGRSAGSEAGEELDAGNDEDEPRNIAMTPDLQNLANLFPFTTHKTPNPNTLELLESMLPTHERALSLSESYLLHAAFFFRPVKRHELINILIPMIYIAASDRAKARINANASSPDSTQSCETACVDTYSPHALATLFFVFALGAVLDLNLPPYNSEAEHYYHLGCAAMSLRSVFDSPQIDTIQAIGLMATYHVSGGKKYTRDSAWCLMSCTAKLAQSVHRDSARWHMDPQMVQKRRTLFWEVFAADVSHCLALGRPPAIHLSYVDCEFPTDEESTLSDTGEIQNGFWRMKYTFGKEMFYEVVEATLTAKPLNYKTVLDLDKRVREISLPTAFKPYIQREDGEEEYFSSSSSLRGFYASQHRTVTMLYLHRSFFAQAMLDHPSNPLLSPFAPSFLTAYRCASIVVKASVHQFDRCPEMAMRVWFLMCHTFSAAVRLIAGTIVTRSPSSNVAASALVDLTQAVQLFERTAIQSHRARIALEVLRRLKEKAVRSYTQYRSATLPALTNQPQSIFSSSSDSQRTEGVEDELAIFGGQTRVLARKTKIKCLSSGGSDSSPSPTASARGSVSPSSVTSPLEPTQPTTDAMMNVHPSLVEYLGDHPFVPGYDPVQLTNLPNNDGQMSFQHVNSSDVNSTASPPSGKQMGEMFSSFMGYLANRSISNASASLPVSNRTSDRYPSVQQSYNQNWDEAMNGSTSCFPQADNSFDWSPPFDAQANLSHRSQISNLPMSITTSDAVLPSSSTALPSQPDTAQTRFIPANGTTSQSYSVYESYDRSPGHIQYAPAFSDPGGPMVELGLMTESEIDSGWFSFMQECGISMDSPSRNSNV
ncbi:hypothetical protein L208DRAFT_1480574 [Tricholoma matsutake]|nr:hypothetical protein L208DRAFT_1480574 [Tricholoma matsutake 945]